MIRTIVLLALMITPAFAGELQICKKGDADDIPFGYEGQDIVIPKLAIFTDVGTIGDVTAPWIKLAVVVRSTGVLRAADHCVTVKANIETDGSNFGTIAKGPLKTSVRPDEKRLLEYGWMKSGSDPEHMAPFENVPYVEATVVSLID